MKADEIRDYFEGWQENLARVKSLMAVPKYYLEAWLVLSCYVGAFGSLRYPSLKDDKDKYKTVVRKYSGMPDFYEQIDLLFFLKWPNWEFGTKRKYLELKNYQKISQIIVETYGQAGQLESNGRYVSPEDVVRSIDQMPFHGYDPQNLSQHIHLFSLCEMLYHYARCPAVHNVRFPFVSRVTRVDRSVRYQDNHAITGAVLLQTTERILGNLSEECREKSLWPWEL